MIGGGDKLVSVIVPVFNNEKWVGRCLESILFQSYKDIEIIVVDDGSTDESVKIIKDYLREDNRIRFISQENHGAGYSRNVGISISQGEYVVFVDSDDFISQDYIEKMMERMTDDIDLVICGYNEVRMDDNIIVITDTYVLNPTICSELTGNIYQDFYKIRWYINSPCLKVYRKKYIIQHNLKFPEDMVAGEDYIFNLSYYRYIKKYAYVPNAGYQYFDNALSITHNRSMTRFESVLKFRDKSVILLEGCEIPDRKKYEGEQIYENLQCFVNIDDNDSVFRYLNLMNKLEKKRTFTILESKRATIILFLYKMHLLWIYYYVARIRRKI